MALTLRTNGSSGVNLVTASWWNDYYSLLTGAMTDQPVTLKYTPGSGTTPALSLQSDAGRPLLKGLTPAGAQAFVMDENGNLTVNSIQTAGGGLLTVTGLTTQQSGAVNGLQFQAWTGSAAVTPFAISGDANTRGGAPTWIGNTGELFQALPSNSDYLQMQPSSGTAARWTITLDGSANMLLDNHTTGSGLTLLAGGGLKLLGSGLIQSGTTFLGFKNSAGTKLAEMNSGGDFIIGAHTFHSNDGGTVTWANGSSIMDSFDVAELYPVTEKHPLGTVLCSHADGLMHRCEHANCPFAHLVSLTPGLSIGHLSPEIGGVDAENMQQYVALVGRVLARCDQDVPALTWVVSDGQGGVRSAQPGETHTLGYTLGPAAGGFVALFIK